MTTSNQRTIDNTITFLDSITEQLFTSGGWPVVHELNRVRNQLSELKQSSPIDPLTWQLAIQASVEDARLVFHDSKSIAFDAIEFMAAAMQHVHRPKSGGEQLTNEEINEIADSMPGGLDGFLKGWGWQQFAHAVLDANEIKMNRI